MDGFAEGLNGYYDVAPLLSEYLRGRAGAAFRATREEKRSIDSREAFEARRDRVGDAFRDAIGGLPDRTGDPPVERTGVVQRDGYSVECLVVESLPDFHVTANCYVPDAAGPHPGILFCCGHVDEAKADAFNQRACAELALNGFVVLAFDPVCQGERVQYVDPGTGDRLIGRGSGGAMAHCYAGQQCFYAGTNLARWVVHDARRALDHLASRPDVDADRIGVTGTSGGGNQTLFLALVDDRVDAAAPCCSVTTRREWLKTGKRVDGEQLIPGAIPAGIDYDDFLAAMAPRPLCVGAAASDEYLPIEGVHEAVDRVRAVYDLYDAAGNVELVVADEPHCSVYEVGDRIFEWFCETLGGGDFESHAGDLAVLEEAALHCTPDGNVRAAFEGERAIPDLVREYAADRHPDAGASPDAEDREVDARRAREAVVDRFDLDRDAPDLHPRFVERAGSDVEGNRQWGSDDGKAGGSGGGDGSEADDLAVRHVFFKTERDPDAVVAGVLVSDPDADRAGENSPAVVLYERGTESLPERSDDVADLAGDHGTVLVFDPRGVGAVRNRPIPVPSWVEDYHGVYGTEFKLSYDALFLGDSLFGMRVYDVLRGVEFLRSETGVDDVALVGEGVGAYHALYAAVADPGVGRVAVRDLGPAFHEMATAHEYPYDPRLLAFDVVGDCDVPHLLSALEDRDLRVDRSGN